LTGLEGSQPARDRIERHTAASAQAAAASAFFTLCRPAMRSDTVALPAGVWIVIDQRRRPTALACHVGWPLPRR
jgi:hypothetical protein